MTLKGLTGWIFGLGAVFFGSALLVSTCRKGTEPVEVEEALVKAVAPDATTRALESELRLKRFPFRGSKFEVEISVKRWCSPGDMDAIYLDTKHSVTPRLRLTLEPLEGTVGMAQSRETTLEEIERGFLHTFDVSRMRPGHAALYLCKDSSGTGRCSDKKLVDINEIFAVYATGGPGLQPGYQAPDRAYFFQYAFFDEGDVVTFSDPEMPNHHVLRLAEWAYKRMKSPQSEALIRSAEWTRRWVAALGSHALERPAGGGAVRMVLPKFDGSSCDRPAVPDPRKAGGDS